MTFDSLCMDGIDNQAILRLPKDSFSICECKKPTCEVQVDSDDVCLVTLIPNRLAYTCGNSDEIKILKQKMDGLKVRFISSDLHHKYVPFAADFGPVNLGIVHRFCEAFSKRLLRQSGLLVYCFESSPESQANACFLLASFMILEYGWTAEEAAAPFQCSTVPFRLRPFHDASYSKSEDLFLEDCLRGLYRASMIGWYTKSGFDSALYEQLDDPLNGDIHEICPKFVAFKGPLAHGSKYQRCGEVSFPPAFYADALRRLNVTCIVRLNEPDTYDRYCPTPFILDTR